MKKLCVLVPFCVLFLAGCMTFSKITPELSAELDARTENTVTIYFGCIDKPNKDNLHLESFGITTDPEIIQEINDKDFSPIMRTYPEFALVTNIPEDVFSIGSAKTAIAVYKTEANTQTGFFTGEFGVFLSTTTMVGNIKYLHHVSDTLIQNREPGTYYLVASCIFDDNREVLFSIEEISAADWAQLVDPREKQYGSIGKDADPNFVRPIK